MKTTNTGQRRKKTGAARTGKPEYVGMVQEGQEREDRMVRTWQKDRVAGTGQLWHDSKVGA
jgi:hypothetical protein